MAVPMNEVFYSGNEPHWLNSVNHQRLRGLSTDFGYPTSGRTLPTYDFEVPMCCAKCEEKVREELSEMDGVCDIYVNQHTSRVTVTGFFDPFQALKKMKRIKKKSQFWNGPRKSSSRDHQISRGQTKPLSRHLETVYHTFPSQVSYNREPLRSSSSSSRFKTKYGSYDDQISYSSRLPPHRNTLYGSYVDGVPHSSLRPPTSLNRGSMSYTGSYDDEVLYSGNCPYRNNFYGSYEDEIAFSDPRSSSSYMPRYSHDDSSSSLYSSQPFRYDSVAPFAQEYDTEYFPTEEYAFYPRY